MKTPGSLMTNKLRLGIEVDAVVDGPGGRVVSGEKSEGTRVTTLVALDARGAERWRTTAAADPLGAVGDARTVVVGEGETCLVYRGSSDDRLACFALADGKRLWDVVAPSVFTSGLFVIGRLLVVVTSQQLEVRELDTGVVKWSLD
jgi:outer membrane protein assembly factor BamB